MRWKPADIYQIRSDEYGSVQKAEGFWRGICEYNQDPKKLGRIKVRIAALHGASMGGADYLGTLQDERSKIGVGISVEALPWAWPCFHTGGVVDSGDFDIPLVGAGIWIAFEQGDPNYPIWFGTWPSMPVREQEANGIQNLGIPERAISMGPWMQPPGLNTPKESQNILNYNPEVRVIAKTPKGATILAVDTDESELLMIIDRLGQVIEMYTPVTLEHNRGNEQQRGVRSAKTQDALDPDTMCVEGKSYIRIIDAKGQFIKLSAEKGRELVRIHGLTNHEVYLDSSLNDEKLIIKNNQGAFICFDKEGSIRIKAKKDGKITIENGAEIDVQGVYKIRTDVYEINCNTLTIKAKNAVIGGTDSIKIISNKTAEISAGTNCDIKAGSAITESAATHTTQAGSIAHAQGGGTPSSSPTPESPGDPAGNIIIPDETFPIG